MSIHHYLKQYFKIILLVLMESGSRKKIRPKLCQMPKLGRLRYTNKKEKIDSKKIRRKEAKRSEKFEAKM